MTKQASLNYIGLYPQAVLDQQALSLKKKVNFDASG